MAGIKIPFLSDVRSFLKGTSDVEKALDDVADSLDDVGKDGKTTSTDTAKALDGISDAAKDAGRDVDTAMTDAGKAGEDGADRIERSFRDALDQVKRDAKSTGDTVDSETTGGTRRSSETIAEFKDEAKSNFSEVASSFSGDMSSAADLVQGTLGGLAGSLPGPVGLISGLLAGIGGGMLASMQTASDKSAEAVESMYDDMIASQSKYLSESYITDEFWKIKKGADDAKISVADMNKVAGLSGESVDTVALAWAGSSEAMEKVRAGLEGTRKAWGDTTKATTVEGQKAAAEIDRQVTTYEKAADARTKAISDTSDAYSKGAKILEDYGITATTTSADALEAESKYRAAVKESRKAVKENGDTLDLNTAKGRANLDALSSLAEGAGDWTEKLRAAGAGTDTLTRRTQEAREAFVKTAQKMGATKEQAEELADAYGLIPSKATTTAELLDEDAKAKLTALTQPNYVEVKPKVDQAAWQRELDLTARLLRPPTVEYVTRRGESTP